MITGGQEQQRAWFRAEGKTVPGWTKLVLVLVCAQQVDARLELTTVVYGLWPEDDPRYMSIQRVQESVYKSTMAGCHWPMRVATAGYGPTTGLMGCIFLKRNGVWEMIGARDAGVAFTPPLGWPQLLPASQTGAPKGAHCLDVAMSSVLYYNRWPWQVRFDGSGLDVAGTVRHMRMDYTLSEHYTTISSAAGSCTNCINGTYCADPSPQVQNAIWYLSLVTAATHTVGPPGTYSGTEDLFPWEAAIATCEQCQTKFATKPPREWGYLQVEKLLKCRLGYPESRLLPPASVPYEQALPAPNSPAEALLRSQVVSELQSQRLVIGLTCWHAFVIDGYDNTDGGRFHVLDYPYVFQWLTWDQLLAEYTYNVTGDFGDIVGFVVGLDPTLTVEAGQTRTLHYYYGDADIPHTSNTTRFFLGEIRPWQEQEFQFGPSGMEVTMEVGATVYPMGPIEAPAGQVLKGTIMTGGWPIPPGPERTEVRVVLRNHYAQAKAVRVLLQDTEDVPQALCLPKGTPRARR